MRQFKPGPSKGQFVCLRILIKLFANLAVSRIEFQRHIGIGHHGISMLARNLRIQRLVFFLNIDGFPLKGAGRTFFQSPFVLQQEAKIFVVPTIGMRGPGTFKPAGDNVSGRFVRIYPTQSLRLNDVGFGRGTQFRCVAVSMRLAHRVAAYYQSNGFFVVHTHSSKSESDIACGFDGIRHTIHAFGIDVNQSHLYSR